MKSMLHVSALAIAAAACSSGMQAIPNPAEGLAGASDPAQAAESPDRAAQAKLAPSAQPTSVPIERSSDPTPVPASAVPEQQYEMDEAQAPLEPTAPAEIGVFAEMRDNLATGETAPDFDARALGNWSFSLSALRGVYVLVVPTAIGCGDCVFTMSQLATAYPDYQGANLRLVLLNLYLEDVPESWEGYADAYQELDAIWAVVNSLDFVVDYGIRSLGTILLVDPAGKLVFRSDFPLIEEELRQLFELATG